MILRKKLICKLSFGALLLGAITLGSSMVTKAAESVPKTPEHGIPLVIIDVDEIKKASPEDFPIKNDTGIFFIKGTIRDFVISSAGT